MKSINLILGNHNHQPVGNFDFVIEDTYQKAYKPFLDLLSKYPNIKFNMHYSGALLEWIEANHYEHIEELKKLVLSKQVEMQGGGFYEPILPSIPDRDKNTQLVKLNEYIKKTFGVSPNGAWLTERVWEPTLVKHYADANLKYIVIDDSQLLLSCIDKNNMHGYFATDDEDKLLNIFPISEDLRYLIPFKEPEEAIEYLGSIATEDGNRLVVLQDDGEKYGSWPGTYEWVYKNEWLKKFFDILTKEKAWIKTVTYSEYLNKHKPISNIYLPTGSYNEMLMWSLPPKEQAVFHETTKKLKKENNTNILPFMRAGFWRNYFSKYNESNRMHKRMMLTSNMVASMKESSSKKKALNYLLKSQCNCPYWHGTFGGLYLNNLRHGTYANIINASKIAEADELKNKDFIVKEIDYDLDTRNEVYISSKKESFILHSKHGSIIEWDIKSGSPTNLVDTMKRREEAYHIEALSNKNENQNSEHVSIHDIVKTIDDDTLKYLVFDKNEKVLCVDHFLANFTTASDFSLMNYNDIYTLSSEYYNIKKIEEKTDKVQVSFEIDGFINDKSITLEKTYSILKKGGLILDVLIKNNSDTDISFVYALENNITLLAGNEKDRYYTKSNSLERSSETLSDFGEYEGDTFGMRDEGYLKLDIVFKSDKKTKFLYMPNFTISDAVDKLEMNYQNSTIVSLIEFNIKSKKSEKYSLEISKKDL